jgi:hypothetical protein
MNNDVAGKLNNKFDAQKKFASNSIEKQAAQKTTNPINSPEFISKNVDKSIESFLNNPEYIQAHVDFCDSLVEHGYSLEDAIKKTDAVFEILHQKETY